MEAMNEELLATVESIHQTVYQHPESGFVGHIETRQSSKLNGKWQTVCCERNAVIGAGCFTISAMFIGNTMWLIHFAAASATKSVRGSFRPGTECKNSCPGQLDGS